ncbi:MAG: NAD(P)/FAD-dependent oxidoreductase [Epulopiscium sp.]|nr:NAD(P)/FAD-dependent oxidoreductase [Candidatus Epulonipiscium sp.]
MLDLVIVGGGASGLVAAIVAAREGAKVTILERTDRVGKKILATGNGRCNITNIDCNIRNYHGSNPKFALGGLTGFDPNMAIQFFEELGIAHKVESGGKVFPLSDQASSVLDVLRMEIDRLAIEVLLDKEVEEISQVNKGFKISCLDHTSYYGDKVIVATGGKASPSLGSNGSGLSLLEKMGHKVINPFPSLVQIILDTKIVRRIQGVKFQGKVTVSDGCNRREELGEILFTKDGISGPPVLQVSRLVGRNEQKGSSSSVSLDLFPDYTLEELEVIIQMRMAYQPKRSLQEFLVGLINKRLIPELLREAGLNDMRRLSSSLTIKEVNKLAQTFKDWKFIATGTRTWNSAQVMAGGISTREVYQDTLQSKKIPGLYIVGELLDIDGDCGGYNLQWAWSSAYMAAIDATSNNK